MEERLKTIIEKNKEETKKGKVADYIPALKKARQEDLGLALVDLEGRIYQEGDSQKKFTIQSISKVISLIQAILDRGKEEVFKHVGYEGTDEAFNSLYKLDLDSKSKPANPMINSGAIVTTSLIKGDGQEKFNKILDLTRKMAGNHNLSYNEEVYKSEKATGDKNRAMAYLMKARGLLEGNVEEILDAYFKQCSIELDVVDLARIGASIGSGLEGLDLDNSLSKKELTSLITGIMANCGMYNYSGQYMAEIAIPSKSGVAGGILGVIPGKMGIGIYGPALDGNGNSLAGIRIMKDLAEEFDLKIW